MKLKALDQMHVSSVRNTPIRPGEEFETSAPEGKQLIAKGLAVAATKGSKAAPVKSGKAKGNSRDKAARVPQNKAEGTPENKGVDSAVVQGDVADELGADSSATDSAVPAAE